MHNDRPSYLPTSPFVPPKPKSLPYLHYLVFDFIKVIPNNASNFPKARRSPVEATKNIYFTCLKRNLQYSPLIVCGKCFRDRSDLPTRLPGLHRSATFINYAHSQHRQVPLYGIKSHSKQVRVVSTNEPLDRFINHPPAGRLASLIHIQQLFSKFSLKRINKPNWVISIKERRVRPRGDRSDHHPIISNLISSPMNKHMSTSITDNNSEAR